MAKRNDVLKLAASEGFVNTPFVETVCRRAATYLDVGYAVHLRGAAGTGKTTLAMHLAAQRGRPVVLIYGDEEYVSSDLTGGDTGVVSHRVVDNFVRSVLKTEESVNSQWMDNRLTAACKMGATLIYDEFSRSRAEANNVLLSILEEGLLALSGGGHHGSGYVQVHPEFRAIFTSNPEEYAGVYTPQSALLDRMITIGMNTYDRETEIAITRAQSGLGERDAARIVDLILAARASGDDPLRPSIRASLMIAKVAKAQQARIHRDDPLFREVCTDVLGPVVGYGDELERLFDDVLGKGPVLTPVAGAAGRE
jgi:gas vesicle protein GvpN